jgi:hypothetical protein
LKSQPDGSATRKSSLVLSFKKELLFCKKEAKNFCLLSLSIEVGHRIDGLTVLAQLYVQPRTVGGFGGVIICHAA